MSLPRDEMDPELQRLVMAETQRAQFTNNVHSLTDICWDLCVDKIQNRTDTKAQKCIANCVGRFVDTSFFIANKLSNMGSGDNEWCLSEQTIICTALWPVICKPCTKMPYTNYFDFVCHQTSLFASKKLLRCLICQMPMRMSIIACPSDHHKTLALVLSLTCRNLSSLACTKRNINRGLYLHTAYPLVCLFLCDLLYLV